MYEWYQSPHLNLGKEIYFKMSNYYSDFCNNVIAASVFFFVFFHLIAALLQSHRTHTSLFLLSHHHPGRRNIMYPVLERGGETEGLSVAMYQYLRVCTLGNECMKQLSDWVCKDLNK